jgi:CubicO group peptidase (beta-lactamase class C family)
MRLPLLSAVALIATFAARPAHAQDLTARLDSTMRAAERNGFSGVVRIEKDGAVLLEQGYGLANRDARIPFTPATVVQIGSNTKDFTAVAILQLQQQGRLNVKDSLGEYFANVPADKRRITLWQLMTHTAGYPLGLGGDFAAVTRQALVDSAMRFRLLFQPGARESYSNTGYAILAAIVEQVSGKTYDEYVRDAILAPLGLRRTGFHLPRFAPNDLAHGYLASGADQGTMLDRPHAADGPYWNLRGNGGMLSTASDMHTFYEALFETDRLLSPAVRALRFDTTEPIGLAGSDLVNFFLYERDPRIRLELIIASTNAGFKAPAARRELAKVLGIPDAGGPGGDRIAQRTGGMPVAAPVAALLREFVQVLNAADPAALRRFITDRFASTPDGPTVDQRVERIGSLRDRLGTITIERVESFGEGPIEVGIRSSNDGAGVLRVDVTTGGPVKIRGLQVMMGG